MYVTALASREREKEREHKTMHVLAGIGVFTKLDMIMCTCPNFCHKSIVNCNLVMTGNINAPKHILIIFMQNLYYYTFAETVSKCY